MRKERKRAHVENYLKSCYEGDNLFQDVVLEHNSLPEIDFFDVDTRMEFMGKTIGFPLLINSMTGGADVSEGINRDLAILSKKFQIPMAVGSQAIALEDKGAIDSFKIVRELMGKDGVVLGNLNAACSIEEVREASKMIQADAMQLHLNVVQEIAMEEGERVFAGILDNIAKVKKMHNKPIMVKEVGFGLSDSVARRLYDKNIRWIDIAGAGGTNFLEIEDYRQKDVDFSDMFCWGNPTAEALIRCRALPKDMHIVASGGMRTAMDIVKALVLGADIVGISGEILSYMIRGGYELSQTFLQGTIYKTKMMMLLLGARNIQELRRVPYRIKGELLSRLESKAYRFNKPKQGNIGNKRRTDGQKKAD